MPDRVTTNTIGSPGVSVPVLSVAVTEMATSLSVIVPDADAVPIVYAAFGAIVIVTPSEPSTAVSSTGVSVKVAVVAPAANVNVNLSELNVTPVPLTATV